MYRKKLDHYSTHSFTKSMIALLVWCRESVTNQEVSHSAIYLFENLFWNIHFNRSILGLEQPKFLQTWAIQMPKMHEMRKIEALRVNI